VMVPLTVCEHGFPVRNGSTLNKPKRTKAFNDNFSCSDPTPEK
jgi:hypothetical protein